MQAIKRYFTISSLLGKHAPGGALPREKEVYKNYFDLAWPAALEGLLMMLFASVDLLMVSDLGTSAVAAVGIISQPRMMILCVSRSFGVAVTALTARRKGEGNAEAVNNCLKQALLLQSVISLFIFVFAFAFIGPIVTLAGASADYLTEATIYGRYIMIGVFFTSLGVIINSVQIGVGNTKIVMQANVAGNIVNIALNFFLIHGNGPFPALGVEGAAIGTMVGNITAFLISLSRCRGTPMLSLRGPGRWRFSGTTMQPLGKVGSSAFGEQIFERIGMFLYSMMVADLGTIAFATHFICMDLCDIFYSFAMGLGKASTSLCGQKLGEGRTDIAVVYGRAGQRLGLVMSVISFLVYVVLRTPFMRLFSDDLAVIALGSDILIFVAVVCLFQFQGQVYTGVLRGAGDTRYVAVYSLVVIAVFRPIATYVFCYAMGMGLYGAWLALTMDQFLRMLFATLRFRSGKWTRIVL